MENKLSHRLKIVRGIASQRKFANDIGVSEPTIRNWESGRTSPKTLFLQKIINATNCNEKWLISGEGMPFNKDEDYYSKEFTDMMKLEDYIIPEEIKSPVNIDIGKRFKAVRESIGYTVDEFSELTSIELDSLIGYESGKIYPRPFIMLLLHMLGVRIEYMLEGKEPMTVSGDLPGNLKSLAGKAQLIDVEMFFEEKGKEFKLEDIYPALKIIIDRQFLYKLTTDEIIFLNEFKFEAGYEPSEEFYFAVLVDYRKYKSKFKINNKGGK